MEGLEGVKALKVRLYQAKQKDTGRWPNGKYPGKRLRAIRRGGNLGWGDKAWFTATCIDEDGHAHQVEDTLERGLEWRCIWHMECPAALCDYIGAPGSPDPEDRVDTGSVGSIAVGYAAWAHAMSYNLQIRPTEDLHGAKVRIWAEIIDAKGRKIASSSIEFGVS